MRTIVVLKQVFRNIKNQVLLMENLYSDLDLDINKEYTIEIKELSNKRTLQQNKYMWVLIRSIANNELVKQDEVEVYSLALEEANIKYTDISAIPEVEDELKKNFRAVRVLRPELVNGQKRIIYRCFSGSSKMNTKEMKAIIDVLISWAEELGIETDEKYYSK